jgi:hypothetical protein
MNVAAGQLSSPAELLDCYNRGVECPKPPPSKRPQYSAEGYKAFIQAAQHAGVKALPQQHREFKIDTSEDTSNFNFGQTSSGGGAHSNGGSLSTPTPGKKPRLKICKPDLPLPQSTSRYFTTISKQSR